MIPTTIKARDLRTGDIASAHGCAHFLCGGTTTKGAETTIVVVNGEDGSRTSFTTPADRAFGVTLRRQRVPAAPIRRVA